MKEKMDIVERRRINVKVSNEQQVGTSMRFINNQSETVTREPIGQTTNYYPTRFGAAPLHSRLYNTGSITVCIELHGVHEWPLFYNIWCYVHHLSAVYLYFACYPVRLSGSRLGTSISWCRWAMCEGPGGFQWTWPTPAADSTTQWMRNLEQEQPHRTVRTTPHIPPHNRHVVIQNNTRNVKMSGAKLPTNTNSLLFNSINSLPFRYLLSYYFNIFHSERKFLGCQKEF